MPLWQDTVLTVGANGNISATFTGTVNAKNLILDPSLGSGAAFSSEVDFLAGSGDVAAAGTVISKITGGYRAGSRGTHGSVPAHELRLDSVTAGAAARVIARAISGAGAEVQVANIIQSDGGSDFLQLLATANLRIAYGTSPGFNWSGGIHTAVNIPHGLGTIPVWAMTSSARVGDALADDARAPWLTTINTMDATNIPVVFSTKNNAAIGVFAVPAGACSWVAIG